jgi:hypothetical protein
MKKLPVVLLSIVALVFAGYAEAAKPKKRSRNANRVGPYGVGFAGITTITSDTDEEAAFAQDVLASLGPDEAQNFSDSIEDSDIGFQAAFGYRFNRYLAAELALVQLGDTSVKAAADMDFGDGVFRPASATVSFSAGGPLISAVGILPVSDRFEFFGRVGYLFTTAKREILLRADGDNVGFGSTKGDSQDLVYGVGASFHFNQVYSFRLEYLKLDGLGDEDTSGTEDLNMYGLGVVVRF